MKKEKIGTIISIIILMISITINVTALGIAPSRKIINYNEEQTITSRILNNNAQNLNIQITASGDLAEYIKINQPILNIQSIEPEKEFTYTINLPSDITPGAHEIEIIATETATATADNSVGGRLAITQQLTINTEYKGQYAEGTISIISTPDNNPITATLNIKNTGTETIQILTGTINIQDAQENIITTKKIAEQNNIQPADNIETTNTIPIEKPGKYTIEYEIEYDNKRLTINKEFTTGTPTIEITNTNVTNFKLGTTAKFNIDIINNWNTAIQDIYGEVTILDNNHTIIGKTEIKKIAINPYTDTLTAYWDTTNIKTGEYTLQVTLYTENKNTTKEYKAKITETTIEITNIKESKKTYYIITAITALLWIIILVLLIKKNTTKRK